jgi:glycosyltransferase involved in cell wall biosynthesis
MSDVAVCTTVFKRIKKIDKLLNSIDSEIVSTVYIADDGEWTDQKERVYSQSFEFNLEVFNLDFDSGLGAGRHKIVQEFDEDYLLLMDSDMQMPENTEILLKQLQNDSRIGGICGLFAEDKKIFSSGCLDIYIEDNIVELEIRESKQVEFLEGYPFIEFDMIANGALFRRECVKEYSWDPEYVIGREHADFYIGHKNRTDWKFGLCPSVHFPHDPGGDEDYLSHRWDDRKYREAEEYLLNKWDFTEYNQMDDNWLDVYNPHFGKHSNPNLIDMLKFKYKSDGLINTFTDAFRFVKNKL